MTPEIGTMLDIPQERLVSLRRFPESTQPNSQLGKRQAGV